MRKTLLAATSLALAMSAGVSADPLPPTLLRDGARAIAPGLERYGQEVLLGRLWRRPDLPPRDRGLLTIAALVARNQAAELPAYAALALDAGLRPAELSEAITHLAFYAGWGNAMAAGEAVAGVFAARGIGPDQLPAAAPALLPLDEAAEARRAEGVARNVRPFAPGLDEFTTDVLFRDLWLRPGLAPRDRSLVTVGALVAAGHAGQLAFHLGRAMDNGLTRAQAAEAIAHLAFYAGWPNAFSAMPAVRQVFEGRPG